MTGSVTGTGPTGGTRPTFGPKPENLKDPSLPRVKDGTLRVESGPTG